MRPEGARGHTLSDILHSGHVESAVACHGRRGRCCDRRTPKRSLATRTLTVFLTIPITANTTTTTTTTDRTMSPATSGWSQALPAEVRSASSALPIAPSPHIGSWVGVRPPLRWLQLHPRGGQGLERVTVFPPRPRSRLLAYRSMTRRDSATAIGSSERHWRLVEGEKNLGLCQRHAVLCQATMRGTLALTPSTGSTTVRAGATNLEPSRLPGACRHASPMLFSCDDQPDGLSFRLSTPNRLVINSTGSLAPFPFCHSWNASSLNPIDTSFRFWLCGYFFLLLLSTGRSSASASASSLPSGSSSASASVATDPALSSSRAAVRCKTLPSVRRINLISGSCCIGKHNLLPAVGNGAATARHM